MAANAYRRAVGDLEGSTARDLDAPFRATVLEPIGKMCSYWVSKTRMVDLGGHVLTIMTIQPEINKAIEKRNKKVSSRIACSLTVA